MTVPRFPKPQGQSLNAWLEVLGRYKAQINENTIFIGHSLGGLFLLRVLEQLSHSVAAAYFVAAPIGIRPILYYEGDEKFSGFKFDWEGIRKKARRFYVYHSDNDPYVSLDNGQELARKLGVELNFMQSAGHLNSESSYTRFDRLLMDVKKIL